ncbi:MAG: hypothetical protein AB1578_13435 [Thermodesulfobacteriota bacterium]
MWIDPIVEEVRAARAAHAAKFGNDLDAIFQDLKRCERESGQRYGSYPPKRLYGGGRSDEHRHDVANEPEGEDGRGERR